MSRRSDPGSATTERAPKNPNGEGGIRRRANGRHEARYTLSDGSSKSLSGASREEVADKLAKARAGRADGVPVVKDDRKTVEKYLGEWLLAIKGNVKPKTWVGYEGYVRLHALPELGKARLTKLQPQQLQALYSKKLDEGMSSTTVNHLHACIHRALDQAVRWGVAVRNVADLVDPPRPARHEMAVLSADQARAFLEEAEQDRLHALYVLAITSGLRQGELLGLRWRDLDLEDATLQVQATMQRTKEHGIGLADPKTGGSRRRVAITGMAVAALRAHRTRQKEERLKAGPAWEDRDLVFCNTFGRPIEATNLLRRSFKPLLAKAGLPAIRFHDLRHSAATLLLKKRVPAKVVSEMLGHSNIGITLNIYSHVLPDMQREATAAMEAALRG